MVVRILDRYTLWGKTWCKVLQADGSTAVVAEDELNLDKDRLTGAHLQYLALAARIREELDSEDIAAAYGSSLLPLPHQVLVLERVLGSHNTRFLLADEVGLGKTIEAGLVMKELKLRGKVRRVLVIAPHSLAAQWQSEMHQRFNEDFKVITPSDLTAVARLMNSKDEQGTASNPWRLFDQVIVPLDTVKPRLGRTGPEDSDVSDYNRLRFDELVTAGWDLVIVDECHKMAGYGNRMARNVLGDAIAQAAPRILLLSATPHQGKTGQFKRLLHILDPQAFTGQGDVDRNLLTRYVLRTEKRKALDYDGKPLFHARHTHLCQVALDCGSHPKQAMFSARMEEFTRTTYSKATKQRNTMLGFLVLLLVRMANSSTETGLDGLTNRLTVLNGGTARDGMFEAEDLFDSAAVIDAESADLRSETSWIEELVELGTAARAEGPDAKTEELVAHIDRLRTQEANPDLKVLIFTEFKATQRMLKHALNNRGYNVVLVNGEMSAGERTAAQKEFAGASQILISTDAGGEGVNLQFCHVVFNYDLPWNPMKIEQRIGRVDRIGQAHDVEAVNLVLSGSVEDRVQQVLTNKLSTILAELGIDKIGDVLDSSIAVEDVEHLYLQSLLDPDASGTASDEFLATVRDKLADYKATVSVLPTLAQADPSRASAIAHNPMPYWCEHMVRAYLVAEGGTISNDLFAYDLVWPDGVRQGSVTFHPQVAVDHGYEQLTAHSDRVQRIVDNEFVFGVDRGIPVMQAEQTIPGVSGLWSLWQVTAKTASGDLVAMAPILVDDAGHPLVASGRKLWDVLCSDVVPSVVHTLPPEHTEDILATARTAVEPLTYQVYQELVRRHLQDVDRDDEARQSAFAAQQQLIDRVALDNVRTKRQRDLEAARNDWHAEVARNQRVAPVLECILAIRIEGEHGQPAD
jgi:superfamily II DNA or RNA helicase